MRKTISTYLLVLASIFMLAHAVVPHHHHDGIVVFACDDIEISNHDHNSHSDNYCDHSTPTDQHQNNCASQDCLLNGEYTKPENIEEQSCHSHCKCEQVLFLTPSSLSNISVADSGVSFRQKPYSATYQSYISVNFVGLRAPPFC